MAFVPPMVWWVLGGATLTGLAVASWSTATRGDAAPPPTYVPPSTGDAEWVDPSAPIRIARYADEVARVTGWGSTLRTYLTAVAYFESRGKSTACHGDCNDDSARGWFQLRRGSYCLLNSGYTPDQMLHNERAQVAIAACHIYRLGRTPYAQEGQLVQTRDIRRGWRFPAWVNSVYRSDPQTFLNRDSYADTLRTLGFPVGFMTEPMFPPGFYWPGFNTVLGAVLNV